jgi:hypothetical protein
MTQQMFLQLLLLVNLIYLQIPAKTITKKSNPFFFTYINIGTCKSKLSLLNYDTTIIHNQIEVIPTLENLPINICFNFTHSNLSTNINIRKTADNLFK